MLYVPIELSRDSLRLHMRIPLPSGSGSPVSRRAPRDRLPGTAVVSTACWGPPQPAGGRAVRQLPTRYALGVRRSPTEARCPRRVQAAAWVRTRRPHWSGGTRRRGTKDLVLILEDVDVPLPRPLIHTVAVIAPHLNALDEGELHAGTPGLRFVPTAFRHRGYLGPGPIPGHGPHRYLFHVFALDIAVPNTVRSTKAVLGTLPGHLLARGVLTGTYER